MHHFNAEISDTDTLVATALEAELARQQNQIELIASENIVSPRYCRRSVTP